MTPRTTASTSKRSVKHWLGLGALGLLGLGLVVWASQIRLIEFLRPLQSLVFWLEELYRPWLEQTAAQNPLLLLPMAFLGGLIASLSPCILSLLPVNLGYIGTREITSRRDALLKAGLFVLGVSTTLSIIGLFSSVAAAIALQYRGYINVLVGLLIVTMGLGLFGIVPLPMPSFGKHLPLANPYIFGLSFALVLSPCASPIVFAVIAAAGATGSQVISVLTMVSYAIGYSMIIFLASLFTGLAKQTRGWLVHSSKFLRIGAVMLVLLGTYYIATGVNWLTLMKN
ncbi:MULTISPECIES: cytochrome c biogenesis protein CcdA [unclassified Leptolyngbya]|uniref:cytochrome c biogenesis CcdA family protein n=1 Tax=unclassified Leptolyngbya TaxID=2650499 RepID=UPI001683EDA5|nr:MULTISPECIES: cytochrome c biogenesis protein CcdA [unclassified Leptolyngbya]MBD1912990.1 cytochrome c biogenesis protein CcdA [Leptolyngbya sp. FACHB-8]MBD2155699.1 cytochrome c biogenesis protein CcdA [Leptolyngbya sp. FACHB-16]